MYTDDNVIISRSPQGPQKCLDALGQDCNGDNPPTSLKPKLW